MPSRKEIAEQNKYLLRRQEQLRKAGEYVGAALFKIPLVVRIALFGSVAAPLTKEVPRFREYRREGIEVWHECKDVDLAVWITDMNCLALLRRTAVLTLIDLERKTGIGVASHQLDIFLLEPGTNRYLGRLCRFNTCPKKKPECSVPGCGAAPFLKQHEEFRLAADSLAPHRIIPLFDRCSNL